MARPAPRERLIAAASDRFHDLGYQACGVKEIADTAGVLKASFYNYYASKEALALEVLDLYRADCRLELLADRDLAPVPRIRAHFEHMAQRYESWGFARGCMIGKFAQEMSTGNPAILENVTAGISRWIDLLSDAIREGQTAGSIASRQEAGQLARFLASSWNGAAVSMRASDSRDPLDDFFAVVFPALLPGM